MSVSLPSDCSSEAAKLVVSSMYSFALIWAVLYATAAFCITVSAEPLKSVSMPPAACSYAAYRSSACLVTLASPAPIAVAAVATAVAAILAPAFVALPMVLPIFEPTALTSSSPAIALAVSATTLIVILPSSAMCR